MSHAQPPVHLIGAPTDIGASDIGARMGPSALRVAGLQAALQAQGRTVLDLGDVQGPDNPQQAAEQGFRHLSQVSHWCQQVHDAVHASLQLGATPLLLGGDHSLAVGSLSAVARHCRLVGKRLRVIWLDAHTDFNTPTLTPTGNLHGMPVACLCGHGPEALVNLSGARPAIPAEHWRLIGIRSVDPGERQWVHEARLPVHDMRHIDEWGMRQIMESALAEMDDRTHLHVSLDVDFLDPDIAPGVATAVRGGPSYREAQLCMEMIADTRCLGSVDIVELNPALDVRNQTARLAVDLIESLFGKSTLMRPLNLERQGPMPGGT